MMMSPLLVMQMSFSTGGRLSSSNFGIVVVMVRSTMPIRPCCTNAFTRKRPMPPGLIAKLHSLVPSNSCACLSFIMARVNSIVCCGVRCWLATGVILPSSLIAGGNPAVMKRSEAFFATIARNKSCMNLTAWSRSISGLRQRILAVRRLPAPVTSHSSPIIFLLEVVLVGGLAARLVHGDDVAPDQIRQVLVERLHAEALAGLDRGVHLRHLVLADQVPDRGRADHDLVRGDAASAVLGLAQRL